MVKSRAARALCLVGSKDLAGIVERAFAQNELLDAVFTEHSGNGLFQAWNEMDPVLAVVEDGERLDGVELVRSFRRSGDCPNNRIPILLLINDATHKRVLAASSAGANRILTTPFTMKKCWEQIEETLTDDRPFVVTDKYVGPERRFAPSKSYKGLDRRRS